MRGPGRGGREGGKGLGTYSESHDKAHLHVARGGRGATERGATEREGLGGHLQQVVDEAQVAHALGLHAQVLAQLLQLLAQGGGFLVRPRLDARAKGGGGEGGRGGVSE